MDVKILPALQDNYMYLIIDKATKDAAIVDPVDPGSVLASVDEEKVNLVKVCKFDKENFSDKRDNSIFIW